MGFFVLEMVCFLGLRVATGLTVPELYKKKCDTSFTSSQRSSAGIPSMRSPASKEITSDSVELKVYCLHVQLAGTNVRLPKIHKIPPEVDSESSRSPTKSESWINPNRQCCAVLHTWEYCLWSLVWWVQEIQRAKRLLWEDRSRQRCQGPHSRVCAGYLSTTSWKRKVKNRRMRRKMREKMDSIKKEES